MGTPGRSPPSAVLACAVSMIHDTIMDRRRVGFATRGQRLSPFTDSYVLFLMETARIRETERREDLRRDESWIARGPVKDR